jgi:hypothetical protein
LTRKFKLKYFAEFAGFFVETGFLPLIKIGFIVLITTAPVIDLDKFRITAVNVSGAGLLSIYQVHGAPVDNYWLQLCEPDNIVVY